MLELPKLALLVAIPVVRLMLMYPRLFRQE